MPNQLIEMQEDGTRRREWAKGWQMGACTDNWKIRNSGRNNPNHSPKTKGIWTIRHSKIKRLHSHHAPLFHVYISICTASKRAAFCQVHWKKNILKRALQAEVSILFKLTAMVGGFLEYSEPHFFQQILNSRNKVCEGPGGLMLGGRLCLLNHTCKLSLRKCQFT